MTTIILILLLFWLIGGFVSAIMLEKDEPISPKKLIVALMFGMLGYIVYNKLFKRKNNE